MIPSYYKGKHQGEAAVLLATGPTLDSFSFDLLPEKTFKTIGVNAILYKDFNLDYYFGAQNPRREKNHKHAELEKKDPLFNRILKIKDKTKIFCAEGYTKIFTAKDGTECSQLSAHPEFFNKEEVSRMDANTYTLSHDRNFSKEISETPLYNYSIVYPSAQFAMYCGFSKLYLVGCDCSGGASYISKNSQNSALKHFPYHWHIIKKVRDDFFPETEIISINPVGLKSLFPYVSNE